MYRSTVLQCVVFCLEETWIIGRFFEGSVEEARMVQLTMEQYEEFIERVQDIHRLAALQGHLGWDQEVLMPAKEQPLVVR